MSKAETHQGNVDIDNQGLLTHRDSSDDGTGFTYMMPKTTSWLQRPRVLKILACLNLILFFSLLFAIFANTKSRSLPSRWTYKTNKNPILKQTSYYSPYLDRVEVPFKDVNVNGHFLDPVNPQSIYKQGPSAKVDAAWNRLQKFHWQFISKEDVLKLGLDPRMTVKAPESWGHGDDAYLSRTDISHRIHCLDTLRRATYPDEVYSHLRNGDPETEPLWRPHVMHCLHSLLQHMMCTSTLEPVTYEWVESFQHPQDNFNINRKCLDIEAVMDWDQREGFAIPDPSKHPKFWSDWLENLPADLPRRPVSQPIKDLFNGSAAIEVGGVHNHDHEHKHDT